MVTIYRRKKAPIIFATVIFKQSYLTAKFQIIPSAFGARAHQVVEGRITRISHHNITSTGNNSNITS
jgi:hypothetical protein